MTTEEIYKLRDSFSIIGLTGRTGSGCTRFSEIISNKIKFENTVTLRSPEYIMENSDNNIFKRKYLICYNFFKKNHKIYKTISYLSVMMLYAFHYIVHKEKIKDEDEFVDFLFKLVKDNFKKSVNDYDKDYKESIISRDEIKNLPINYSEVISRILNLNEDIDKSDKCSLYNSFFVGPVKDLCDSLFMLLKEKDYYLGSFFVHRLGNKIRATGNPFFSSYDKLSENSNTENIYSLVSIINLLIKSWRAKHSDRAYICIDSLRNSLEIMFLKERYAEFYMIAIHNEGHCENRIRDRITQCNLENNNSIELIISKVINLDEKENQSNDFKNGHFFSPDVENCIQKSDIHIGNVGKKIEYFNQNIRNENFYTMIEQWIKIQSLILHPGLITPTHEERCMQIAFITKYNSGCISRQVGAVITDRNHMIRSVGWNDVPKYCIPCNLRDVSEIVNNNYNPESSDKTYSEFELSSSIKTYEVGENKKCSFKEMTSSNFTEKRINKITEKGLNYSYCFRTLHNDFKKEKNQVHTRSLHAEENAMMNLAKFGGEPLEGGTLYTTASPCELCAKKAYQLGLKIVYIDPYPGISNQHILNNGYNIPEKKLFTGIVGRAYMKLYEPLLSYKDEIAIIENTK